MRLTRNLNNIYKTKVISIIAVIILLLLFVNLTNLLYYIAYTIDYIINRSTYHFKEEAQYKDNRLIQNDYFLTTFEI